MRRDRAFRKIVAAVGAPPRRRSATPLTQRFSTLARAITYQLLATKAANTIHQRVIDACAVTSRPCQIIKAGHAKLRDVGLSNRRRPPPCSISPHALLDGRTHLARHGRMSDHDVLADVVAVRGIGPWTAQMYLMHTLARHDVWPAGDLGVRNGWTILHGLDELITEKDLRLRR